VRFYTEVIYLTYELRLEINDIDRDEYDTVTFTSKDKLIKYLLSLLNSYTFMNPTMERKWR
jgi:hypothetical protein